MTKSDKPANRQRQLERENYALSVELECAATVRKALTRETARLKMENRNLRKRRGPWFRLWAWLRARRKR